MTSDHIQAWYDESYSAGGAKQSLRSALSRNSVWVQQCNSAVIEDRMMALCSSIDRKHKLNPAVRMQTNIDSSGLESPPLYLTHSYNEAPVVRTDSYHSVDQGIELADDLIMSYECFMRSVTEAKPSRRADDRSIRASGSNNCSDSSHQSIERTVTIRAPLDMHNGPKSTQNMHNGPIVALENKPIPKDTMRHPVSENSRPVGANLQNRFQSAKEQFTNGVIA